METVVSGIRPTGNLHLGNYFGAVKSFLQMQNEYNCYFFIADWHSLTTHPKPNDIVQSARTILAEYLVLRRSIRILQGAVNCNPSRYGYARGKGTFLQSMQRSSGGLFVSTIPLSSFFFFFFGGYGRNV